MNFEVPAQESIAEVIAGIESRLLVIERRKTVLLARRNIIRGMCEHPETEELNPMNKWPFRRCKTCGKRW